MPANTRASRGRRWGLVVPACVLGLVVLAPIAALLATAWVLGWGLQVVETSSMRPLYPQGSLVAVQPIDAADVEPGMVIVFRDPAGRDRLVAHRAVKRLPGEQPIWQTQGDANRDPDPYPVHVDAVRGRVRWGVPGLGHVVSALTGWHGAAILVGGPLGLLAISEWSSHSRQRSGRRLTKAAVGEANQALSTDDGGTEAARPNQDPDHARNWP